MAKQRYPVKGDSVWVEGRPQPNGRVRYRDEDEVAVDLVGGEHLMLDLSAFDGMFNERLNQWLIYKS